MQPAHTVRYRHDDGNDHFALVDKRLEDNMLDLWVFLPGGQGGLSYRDHIPHDTSENPPAGTWH